MKYDSNTITRLLLRAYEHHDSSVVTARPKTWSGTATTHESWLLFFCSLQQPSGFVPYHTRAIMFDGQSRFRSCQQIHFASWDHSLQIYFSMLSVLSALSTELNLVFVTFELGISAFKLISRFVVIKDFWRSACTLMFMFRVVFRIWGAAPLLQTNDFVSFTGYLEG